MAFPYYEQQPHSKPSLKGIVPSTKIDVKKLVKCKHKFRQGFLIPIILSTNRLPIPTMFSNLLNTCEIQI